MPITATATETLAALERLLRHDDGAKGPTASKPNDHGLTVDLIDYLIVQSTAATNLAELDAHFDAVKALLTADTATKLAEHERQRNALS